jgi:1-acyl-sn-glycerol-3-phosphate acyltransferase
MSTTQQRSFRSSGPNDFDVDRLVNEPARVQAFTKRILGIADAVAPVFDLVRIHVDGLENLPRDGRFLLVGNHTVSGFAEVVLIPFVVHRELGVRVRGLANQQMTETTGVVRDVLEAAGAVPGRPETCAELMRQGEAVLVFPGGGRDMLKFKGEEYTLQWERRSGFARMAVAHGYPIVPVGLVGGDDVYRSVVRRGGAWETWSRRLGERLHGLSGVGIPLVRGWGPTLIPRPQRMYLRFAPPIATSQPARVDTDTWTATVKDRTQTALAQTLADLQALRAGDPFRNLNPLAWHRAARAR